MENKLSRFVGGINSTESKTNLMFAISSRIFFRKCCYFLWKVKKKKYLLLVRLEIRRESDSFDRSGQIRIFSSFFFRRPITFIRGAYSNFPLLFFLSFLSFNNRNGRHPEINRIVGGEGCKNTRASFVTMV